MGIKKSEFVAETQNLFTDFSVFIHGGFPKLCILTGHKPGPTQNSPVQFLIVDVYWLQTNQKSNRQGKKTY